MFLSLRRSVLRSAQQEFVLEVRLRCDSWLPAEHHHQSSWKHAVVCCLCGAAGGLFVGLPLEIPLSSMLSEADLQVYVSQYKERGFRWCTHSRSFLHSKTHPCTISQLLHWHSQTLCTDHWFSHWLQTHIPISQCKENVTEQNFKCSTWR